MAKVASNNKDIDRVSITGPSGQGKEVCDTKTSTPTIIGEAKEEISYELWNETS